MNMRREKERVQQINRAIRQTEDELDTLQGLRDVTPELLSCDEKELRAAEVLRDHYYNIGDIGSAEEQEDEIEALKDDIAFGEATIPELESEIDDVQSELDDLKQAQDGLQSEDVDMDVTSVDVEDEMQSDAQDESNIRGAVSNVAKASQLATGSRRLPSALEKIEKHAQRERDAEEASPLHRRSKFM